MYRIVLQYRDQSDEAIRNRNGLVGEVIELPRKKAFEIFYAMLMIADSVVIDYVEICNARWATIDRQYLREGN